MKELINRLKKVIHSNIFIYCTIMLLGVVICIPLFTMNLNEYNEFRIHIGRIVSIKEVIGDGVFPPFISYKHMLTYGYALNIFYGVLTTYIPIAISLFTGTSILALKVFTVITVILSGITMYWFVFKVTNKKGASLIAALVYMAAPYKFCDIYSRNAVGEYTAFIFIPMIFQGIYQLLNDDKKGNYFVVIGTALLILSHTITTIYTAFFIVIYLLFNTQKLKNKKIWKYFAIDGALIIMLTLFYIVPLIEHKVYGSYAIYDANLMNTSGEAVYQTENTNRVSDWFAIETHTDLNFSFGIVITFLMIDTVFCRKKLDKKVKDTYWIFWILALISLFMCTRAFPWIIMPQFLTVIQFAWRLNGFFIFFIALVCGINADILANFLGKIKNEVVLGIAFIIFIMSYLSVSKYTTVHSKEAENNYEIKLIEATEMGPMNINRDYLPSAVNYNLDYIYNRENKAVVLKGSADIENERKVKLHDELELSNVDSALVELPFLYYHGYTVKLNGNIIKNYESENGFVCVDVNENGKIEIDYTGTSLEKISIIISLIGWIIYIFYVIREVIH